MNIQEEILKIKNEMIDEFDKRVEALKVDEREFPQDRDDYWYVNDDAEVMDIEWDGSDNDQDRLSIGNVFKTKDQAEFQVEKLRVEAELRKFSRPFKYGQPRCNIILSANENVGTDYWNGIKTQGTIYFESKEKAQQAIEAVGEERIKKYIFGV